MKIWIVAFGKLRGPGMRVAADYYLRLLSKFSDAKELELKSVPIFSKSTANKQEVQKKEMQTLLPFIVEWQKKRSEIYLMDESGEKMTSLAWAKFLERCQTQGLANLILCIGSSVGFSKDLIGRTRGRFSFGLQTMSHEIARVVLLEQLYRAWSIIKGHSYHNEG